MDFTAVLARRPDEDDLAVLARAHDVVATAYPDTTFEGSHCLIEDLRAPWSQCPPLPVAREGGFEAEGTLDVNPVTVTSWPDAA